ncbi:autotransporter domain-containing protein [Sphingobium sp. CAP-1]|uniref:autotransporter domain-containing protein n=1 Tax=Sphingobium sp. CAP-1 TaxID=2676077 RepID=UPI0012BB4664|nr:autotransporter domain-containing protein [Sphingobium sp. CAP-1]QGP81164.1 hypothetical protein GL174_19170 [Sphingobium sp. CAP-1]
MPGLTEMWRPWAITACIMGCLGSVSAEGQTGDAAISAPSAINRSFGDSGLMARFNSSEQYGAVQARIGLYNAHNNLVAATGSSYIFDDNVTAFVTPANAIIPVPALGKGLHVKVGYANIMARGGNDGPTQIDNDTQVGMAQLVWLSGDNVLIGAGVIHETSDVSLRHNGGDISTQGNGWRVDMLYRFAPQWGASLRVSQLGGDADSIMPNVRFGAIRNRQNFRRRYSEAALIGTYRKRQLGGIPHGWVMRPALAFVWQDSKFDRSVNSLAASVAGRREDYMLGIATIRLEKDGFRPWNPVPYGEAGLESEVRNTIAKNEHDPSSLYLKTGVAMNLGGKGRLDLYAARRDSLKGSFQSTTFNLLLSMAF